jgi:hypothetical protein
LTAQVRSPVPGNVIGRVEIFMDGQYASFTYPNGPAWIDVDTLGTHQFHATYEGDATHPPATSDTIEVTVVRAATRLSFGDLHENHFVRYGQQPEIRVVVGSEGSGVSAGTLYLYDGSTLLASAAAQYNVPFTLPILSPGVHYLQAKYSSSENHEPSQSAPQRLTILPADGFALDVYAYEAAGPSGSWRRGSLRCRQAATTRSTARSATDRGSTSPTARTPRPCTPRRPPRPHTPTGWKRTIRRAG